MKKFFECLGLVTLLCFSFFYTEKTASVVKEVDDIMITLRDKADAYEIRPIEAVIEGDTIVPGIYGRKVNIEASYKKMKKIGSFHENYLVFDKIAPEQLLKENMDKYVIGLNMNQKVVSLIFLVEEYNQVNDILNVLDRYQMKANFFIDGGWFEKNNDMVLGLMEQGHNVGNLSYQKDYQNSSFVWMDTIIKRVGKQKYSFCYATAKKEDLEICAMQKNYTIRPSLVIEEHPFIEVKNNVKAGDIIAFSINRRVVEELDLILSYLQSKDYQVGTLVSLLDEGNTGL